MTNEQTQLQDAILAKHEVTFPSDANVKAAMHEFAEQNNQEVIAAGTKAYKLLSNLKGIFERWDDRTHADFVSIMNSEVIPFVTGKGKEVFAHQ